MVAKYVNGMDISGHVYMHDGLEVDGTKLFRSDHPTKPGHVLRHGATESPVSGVEYWGRGILSAAGTVTLALPEYFEVLCKPDERIVILTPVTDPVPLAASPVLDGRFTVTGPADTRFSWLVKAERYGADFPVEAPEELL